MDFRDNAEGYVKHERTNHVQVDVRPYKTLDRWADVVLYMRVYGFRLKQNKAKGGIFLQTSGYDGVKCYRNVTDQAARTLYLANYLEPVVDKLTFSEFRLSNHGIDKADAFLADPNGTEATSFKKDSVDCPNTGVHALRNELTAPYLVEVPKDVAVKGEPVVWLRKGAELGNVVADIGKDNTVHDKFYVNLTVFGQDNLEALVRTLRGEKKGVTEVATTTKTKEVATIDCAICGKTVPVKFDGKHRKTRHCGSGSCKNKLYRLDAKEKLRKEILAEVAAEKK